MVQIKCFPSTQVAFLSLKRSAHYSSGTCEGGEGFLSFHTKVLEPSQP